MSKEKIKGRILVAIDTGFDGCKMRVNGLKMNIPFVIQDITETEQNYNLRRIDDSFVRCTIGEHTYIIGEVARTYLLSSAQRAGRADIMEEWYTMARFKTSLFETALSAFIAYGLHQYSEYTIKQNKDIFLLEESDKWDIMVGVALPHTYVDTYMSDIHLYIAGTKEEPKVHELEISVGSKEPIHCNFRVSRTFFNSQLICVLLNELLNDDGEDIEEGKVIYDYLPALVIDAGYKTLGNCEFGIAENIIMGDSNTEYAMMNINNIVAEQVRNEADDNSICQGYMVDELVKRKDKVNYLKENKACSIDVGKIKKTVFKETTGKLIDYLLKKYNNLLEEKMIIVAGGTGSQYYPAILEFCKEKRSYLADNVILAGDQEAYGCKCEAIYAVVTGLYKDMVMQLANDENE